MSNRALNGEIKITSASEEGCIPESRSRPIKDYAVIGDCRTAALVSRCGAIEWLCLPHFSAPAVFSGLLDLEKGGVFSIQPQNVVRSTRRYLTDTNVLVTEFQTAAGAVRVTDLMSMPLATGLAPMREVLRKVEIVEGIAEIEIVIDPRPDYARRTPRIATSNARREWTWRWRDELLWLRTELPLNEISGSAVGACITLRAGDVAFFSLCFAKSDLGVSFPVGQAAEQRLQETVSWWRNWSSRCCYGGPYRDTVIRSALALKLLTSSVTGGVVAAVSSSLPEEIGGQRNWDYRYCWLRDASLTMQAFTGLGYMEEAGRFFSWLLHATRLTWPRLNVFYDIYGRIDIRCEELEHLSGFSRSKPVRIGNAAGQQVQLDAYGALLHAALEYTKAGGCLQPDEMKLIKGFADTVCKCWSSEGNGIWEIPHPWRQYTLSKVWCWVALHCLLKFHERDMIEIDSAPIRSTMEQLEHTIERFGFNSNLGAYTSTLSGETIDASLLLMASLGYRSACDERMKGTYAAIRRRLKTGGLLYRYEKGFDSLPGREGAFALCSFWEIEYLAASGAFDEAQELFGRLLECANDLGLYAEEISPTDGALLGNFPQAFTHVGVIRAALALDRAAEQRKES